MDKSQAVGKARQYIALAKEIIDFNNAVLFGSYAHGEPHAYSDIDIGLFVDHMAKDEDYLGLMVRLYRLTGEVDIRIEPHLFIRSEDRSGFAGEMERTGISLWN